MSQSLAPWISASVDRLLQLRVADVGWGYRREGIPYSEPTALGCLALLAVNDQQSTAYATEMATAGADWLASLQQPDGAVGISAELSKPRWPTAYAILLWSQVPGYESQRARSLTWLQQREGHTYPKSRDCVLGHDTSIPGWPWVAGTHPWLEPTGIAMLALCRNQLAGHQRVRDGIRLVLDRAIVTGGWNVGNSATFGKPLRPQGGPTGIALLALRAALHEETPTVTRGCDYLLDILPTTRAPETLGWGLLGLLAWRPRPDGADDWLREALENSSVLHHAPLRLATLLLAASCSTLSRLGVTPAVPHQAAMEVLVP